MSKPPESRKTYQKNGATLLPLPSKKRLSNDQAMDRARQSIYIFPKSCHIYGILMRGKKR